MAIGKCDEQQDIEPEKVSIAFGDLLVYRGQPLLQDRLPELKAYLQQPEIAIRVSLGSGTEATTVWGCDLTHEYVRINSEYTT